MSRTTRIRPLAVALIAIGLLVIGFGLYVWGARSIAQSRGQAFVKVLLAFEKPKRDSSVCVAAPDALWCMPTGDIGADTYWVTDQIFIDPICVLAQSETEAKVFAVVQRTGYAITPHGRMFQDQRAMDDGIYHLTKIGETWQVARAGQGYSNLDALICGR